MRSKGSSSNFMARGKVTCSSSTRGRKPTTSLVGQLIKQLTTKRFPFYVKGVKTPSKEAHGQSYNRLLATGQLAEYFLRSQE